MTDAAPSHTATAMTEQIATAQRADQPSSSRWPKVIGVLSLLYALGGLLCQSGWGAMSVFGDVFIRMGGGTFEAPTAFRIVYGALAVAGLVLGIYMLAGSIALLRRVRAGAMMLRRWAVARLLLLLVAALASVVFLQVHIDFGKAGAAMSPTPAEPRPDESLVQQHMITTGIMTGVFAAYPIFIGFYLTRRKISDEMMMWA